MSASFGGRGFSPAAVLLAALVASAALVAAQQPQLSNGQVHQVAVTGSLDRTFRDLMSKQTEPAWIGYAVPVISGERNSCCWYSDGPNNGVQGCHLEPGARDSSFFSTTAPRSTPVSLEPPSTFFVMYRIENRAVERIRVFSMNCPVEAGGRAVHWLTGVTGADSVALLKTFAGPTQTRKIADSALTALAMHAEPAALALLVDLARNDASTQVRGQALFWLAQRAGEKAVGTITEAIERDPDTEVKKRAVFALSQLPKDQGIPLLIDQARGNKNPVVRKQAIFWLGQTKDPRALKFIEEILFK